MYQGDDTMLRSDHVCWSDVADHWSNDSGQTGPDNICKVNGNLLSHLKKSSMYIV